MKNIRKQLENTYSGRDELEVLAQCQAYEVVGVQRLEGIIHILFTYKS